MCVRVCVLPFEGAIYLSAQVKLLAGQLSPTNLDDDGRELLSTRPSFFPCVHRQRHVTWPMIWSHNNDARANVSFDGEKEKKREKNELICESQRERERKANKQAPLLPCARALSIKSRALMNNSNYRVNCHVFHVCVFNVSLSLSLSLSCACVNVRSNLNYYYSRD